MRQLGPISVYGAVIAAFLGCTTLKQPTADQLIACEQNSQCVLVSHSHCCGSTKMAINRKYQAYYDKTPALQKTDDPKICAVIGLCMDDSAVTSAQCVQGECGLLWPK